MHIHLTALCPGLPRWASTRKVKPIWILLKQESEWQWHQLDHMQVCTSLQTDNHASTPPLSFLQAGFPSCHPTNSIKALKAQKISSTMKRKPNEIQNTGLSAQTQVTTYCRKAWAGIQYSIIPHSMCAQEPTVLVIIRHLHDHWPTFKQTQTIPTDMCGHIYVMQSIKH